MSDTDQCACGSDEPDQVVCNECLNKLEDKARKEGFKAGLKAGRRVTHKKPKEPKRYSMYATQDYYSQNYHVSAKKEVDGEWLLFEDALKWAEEWYRAGIEKGKKEK